MRGPLIASAWMGARYGRVVGWSVLAIALVFVAGYLILVVTADVRPPVVAVEAEEDLPGLARGDAIFVEPAPGNLPVGEIIVGRIGGDIVVGRLAQTTAVGDEAVHLLEGTGRGPGPVVEMPVSDVIGVAGRKVGYLGWPLLLASDPAGLVLLTAVFLLVAVGLYFDHRRDGRVTGLTASALNSPTDASVPRGPAHWPYGDPPVTLTPDDVRAVQFRQMRRGYDTEEVDRALDVVANSVEALLTERKRLVERLRVAEADLERQRVLARNAGERPVQHADVRIDDDMAPVAKDGFGPDGDEAVEVDLTTATAPTTGAGSTNGRRAAVDPSALVILLGETRAMRSLLQTLVDEQAPLDVAAEP
jgi:DivIVA domain-containing protein